MDVTCGVPQGLILRFLFLLYVNDMHISVSCRLALYADDSALIFSHTDVCVMQYTLSSDLGNCSQWLLDNKLSLHIDKTECVMFCSGRHSQDVENCHVKCGTTTINCVDSVSYLGIQLTGNMSGRVHAENVIKRFASRFLFISWLNLVFRVSLHAD